MPELHGDVVIACADLVGRAGASGFEMAWDCPHVPDEPDDHTCLGVTWSATATYRGARLIADEHRTPSAAALALAERLLSGAVCRCGQPVSLADERPGCRWRLLGKRWEPGCDARSVKIGEGNRGDLPAMHRALGAAGNRAQRRAARKRGGG